MNELCFDISTWQGGIDYQAIRDRVNYCILRAGFSTTKDNQFENHYWNLQGLNLGAYWYSYAQSVDEAREEAYKFLEIVDGKQFTLPLYLDIEDPSMAWLGADTLNDIVRTFGDIIQDAGYYFGVYTNLNWYRNIISGSWLNERYDWWIACWSDYAPEGVDYGVWQFTSDYNDFGWRLDANWIYKDYPTIIREAGLNHLNGDKPDDPDVPDKPSKSIDELAQEVIQGLWGNGEERYQRLTDAGYDYNAVQNRVNEILEPTTTYIVQPGDSLSSIAVQFGTTWQDIYNKNKYLIGDNPNLIYPGQKLII